MKKNEGLTLVALVITIIIILILAGVSLSMTIGKNGILTKATTVEAEYNKSEVLEELNIVITEKYLDAYSRATKEDKLNLEKYYTPEKVIEFLKGHTGGDSGEDYTTVDAKIIIEDLKVGSDEENANAYFVKLSELKGTFKDYGKGKNEQNAKDYYFIKKESEETYMLYYNNELGENEQVGALQIQQQLQK